MNRLENLRELSDFTKKDISKILGVSDSIYARWENGKDFIPTKRLYQIAKFYNVNIDYILGLTNNKLKSNFSKFSIDVSSKRIHEIRLDSKKSLRDFASSFNTSGSTWCAYENGKVLILGAFLLELCQKYNVSADWVLGISDKKYLL